MIKRRLDWIETRLASIEITLDFVVPITIFGRELEISREQGGQGIERHQEESST